MEPRRRGRLRTGSVARPGTALTGVAPRCPPGRHGAAGPGTCTWSGGRPRACTVAGDGNCLQGREG